MDFGHFKSRSYVLDAGEI